MSPIKCAGFLGIVALITAAGCAGGTRSATLQSQGQNCRNRGVYNRAADLCVSEGP